MNYKHEDLVNLPHISQIIASMIPYSGEIFLNLERHLNRVDKCLEVWLY